MRLALPIGLVTLLAVQAAAADSPDRPRAPDARAVEPLLAGAGIAPTARAEELSVAEFCALARALEGQSTCGKS